MINFIIGLIKRIIYGFDNILTTPIMIYHFFREGIKKKFNLTFNNNVYFKIYERFIIKKYGEGKYLNFNGFKTKSEEGLYGNFIDIFFPHIKTHGKYDSKIIKKIDDMLGFEGSYFYNDGNIKILVKTGDIVIDAGAFTGGFSKICAYYGAKVYAFEPTKKIFDKLRKEIRGEQIIPINLGLGDIKKEIGFEETDGINNKINESVKDNLIKITTIDNFIKDKKIKKIDFIKADIEGYERYMLMGAQQVLKNHEPILSICTYHLADDPVILASIIKKANNKYKIIQMKHKLYAYIPGKHSNF